MKNTDNYNRLNSFLVPWFTDGSLSIVFAAAPLLAKSQGADVLFLGTMGVMAQAVRLPLCLVAGRLSEKIGSKQVSVPAGILTLIGCIGLALSKNTWSTALFFALCVAMMGGFYPPFQAYMGSISGPGRLAKNVGAFNVGWCVGSAAAAFVAAYLIKWGFVTTFAAAASYIAIGTVILLLWKSNKSRGLETKERIGNQPADVNANEIKEVSADTEPLPVPKIIHGNDSWLTIGRFGHFVGFYGYASVRILFPAVGKAMNWSDSEIMAITGILLWGLGAGIITTSISPWWRGKIWSQLGAHAGMVVSAIGMGVFNSKAMLGASFFLFGVCLATCYTAAIYHGLAARSKMGHNMGIHEALVAAGQIFGSLIGGLVARSFGLRVPYFILAGIALCALMGSVYLYMGKLRNIKLTEAKI